MKEIKLIISFAIILVLSSINVKSQCNSGKLTSVASFSVAQLESNWTRYSLDPAFKVLIDEVKRQGFIRIEKSEITEWGFNAKYQPDTLINSGFQSAEVCGFDFYKKTATGYQFCSMVWRKIGGTVYKCFMIFPPGVDNPQKAFANSVEYFVDENNKIQLASSFGRCWSRCIARNFSSSKCASAIVVCGSAAAGLTTLGIGVTTPMALGIFAFCAGIDCLLPLASCAAYCL